MNEEFKHLAFFEVNGVIAVSGRCDHLNNRKAKLVTFIPEEVRYDLIGIRVNPLAENKYIQKQQAVMEEVRPEVSLKFNRTLYAFVQNFFGYLDW